MTFEALIIMATAGAATGAMGGALSAGQGGLIIGGTTGLVLGSMIWTVTTIVSQMRRERRLDRYFQQQSSDGE